ncbi:MAG: putative rane-anchored protein [Mycobacterium sp.]|jgi:uncharacterized membrane-anchored protein|nr:putative rane-anchored protein [Mycobacterium sp.]
MRGITVSGDGYRSVSHQPISTKVPEITASFWVLKLLTTAMGEAASDYLLSTVGLVGVGIGFSGFVVCLWLQLRTRRYKPFAYWGAVAMIAAFGTMAADVLHGRLGVPIAMSTLIYGLAVATTFWVWHRAEGSLSIHSITTRRREIFYWLAVSFTFALGTAAGDLTAGQLKLGFAGSIVLFAVAMAVPALGYWRFRLNSVVAFWWAYILTRPLGASIADWVSKPPRVGALGYGDGPVAAVLLIVALLLLTMVAVSGRNTANSVVGLPIEAEAAPSTP